MPNTTAEMLARRIGDRWLTELEKHGALGKLDGLEVAVEEADHQCGIYRREVGRA